jgi:hypothetical protein
LCCLTPSWPAGLGFAPLCSSCIVCAPSTALPRGPAAEGCGRAAGLSWAPRSHWGRRGCRRHRSVARHLAPGRPARGLLQQRRGGGHCAPYGGLRATNMRGFPWSSPCGYLLGCSLGAEQGKAGDANLVIARGLDRSQATTPFPLFSIVQGLTTVLRLRGAGCGEKPDEALQRPSGSRINF